MGPRAGTWDTDALRSQTTSDAFAPIAGDIAQGGGYATAKLVDGFAGEVAQATEGSLLMQYGNGLAQVDAAIEAEREKLPENGPRTNPTIMALEQERKEILEKIDQNAIVGELRAELDAWGEDLPAWAQGAGEVTEIVGSSLRGILENMIVGNTPGVEAYGNMGISFLAGYDEALMRTGSQDAALRAGLDAAKRTGISSVLSEVTSSKIDWGDDNVWGPALWDSNTAAAIDTILNPK